MNTAMLVRDNLDGWAGHAALYRLDPPMGGVFDHVVVSAVVVPVTGPETYVFRSDEEGNVSRMEECSGSYRGGIDHAEALARAGWRVLSDGQGRG